MATTARVWESANARPSVNDRSEAVRRKSKIAAVLITSDDSLWPQIGKFVPSQFVLKQADCIEQMLKDTEAGAAAVLIWDARGEDDAIQRLTLLQQHSNRFAVLAVDAASNASGWDALVRTNQVVALVATPISEGEFVKSLNKAGEEVLARSAILGEPQAARVADVPAEPGSSRRIWAVGALLAVIAAVAAVVLHRGSTLESRPAPAAAPAAPAPASAAADAGGAPASVSEQVEDLLEKAGQAMLDRRYIAPADNSALSYYRRVLNFDAQNGEARQGLQRLAELLLARAQAALDSHQFEQALQALETARSLKPDDARTRALDQRLANMRAELGTTQIQASVNAQNFERAALLIDEAAKAHTISPVQTAQLREALKRQREDFEINRFIKLAQARLQQDRLVDPENDSAAYYLERARRAGATESELLPEGRALLQRLLESARSAIDQHRLNDADRWIAEARREGAGNTSLGALQGDLANARSLESRGKPVAPVAADPAHPAANASAVADAGESHANDGAAQSKPAVPAPAVALVLTKPIRPEYPRAAVLKGQEGWVELNFTINAEGRVVNAQVTDSSPAGVFDQAALRAVQSARYQPLSKTDPSVSRQTKLKLAFRLLQ